MPRSAMVQASACAVCALMAAFAAEEINLDVARARHNHQPNCAFGKTMEDAMIDAGITDYISGDLEYWVSEAVSMPDRPLDRALLNDVVQWAGKQGGHKLLQTAKVKADVAIKRPKARTAQIGLQPFPPAPVRISGPR